MNKTILGLVIVASIFLAGCPVSDLHPLYNDGDNVSEPLLVGKWLPPDASDKGSISFEKASGPGYTMIVDGPDFGFSDRYDCRLVRLGGNLFADLHFTNRSHGDASVDMPFTAISVHMVIRLAVTKDELGWAAMEDDGFKNSTKQGTPSEKSGVGSLAYDADDALVLADTETLRRYVTAHAQDGFSDVEKLKRAK